MQNELLMFQFTDACYWMMSPLTVNLLNDADQRSGRWQIGQHRFLNQATAAKLSRKALIVASMSASE